MEFIKKLVQTNQERGRASIQLTVENDVNLPDYEPDMIKLIDRKGMTRIQETKVEPDQIVVSGVLLFQALYKCAESGSICSLAVGKYVHIGSVLGDAADWAAGLSYILLPFDRRSPAYPKQSKVCSAAGLFCPDLRNPF